jgi:hypothetical protein
LRPFSGGHKNLQNNHRLTADMINCFCLVNNGEWKEFNSIVIHSDVGISRLKILTVYANILTGIHTQNVPDLSAK